MPGWTGKILRVNLTTSEIKTISTQPYAKKYPGGRVIASRIYWDNVSPEAKAVKHRKLTSLSTTSLQRRHIPGPTANHGWFPAPEIQ